MSIKLVVFLLTLSLSATATFAQDLSNSADASWTPAAIAQVEDDPRNSDGPKWGGGPTAVETAGDKGGRVKPGQNPAPKQSKGAAKAAGGNGTNTGPGPAKPSSGGLGNIGGGPASKLEGKIKPAGGEVNPGTIGARKKPKPVPKTAKIKIPAPRNRDRD